LGTIHPGARVDRCVLDDVGLVMSGLLGEPCTTKLLGAVLVHDYDTHRHLLGVGTLAARVAVTAGFSCADALRIAKAGLFHDIGKLHVDGHILRMRGPLSLHDWSLLRAHPEIGEAMLRDAGERCLAAIVRGHHERLDGSGYPDGVRGLQIRWETRLLSVVDAYDAMRAGRPYAEPIDHEAALERLVAAHEHFDQEAVGALIATIEGKAEAAVS